MAFQKTSLIVAGLVITLGVVFLTYNLGRTSAEVEKISSQSRNSQTEPNIQVLSWSPRVLLYKNFLTDAECDYIVEKGGDQVSRSKVIGRDGKGTVSSARSSYGTFLSKLTNDPIIKGVAEKISKWTAIPEENGEVFYLLRYENGQEYKPHMDWFERKEENARVFAHGGQRIATVVSYLSDVDEGGETFFPKIDLVVQPNKGDAVLFWNVLTNNTEDIMALHGSKPVKSGTKWAMTKWLREKSFS